MKTVLIYLLPANEVWGKVIFSEACVKNYVHRGGSASVHAGIPHPPGPGTPRDQAPLPPDQAPPEQSMLGDTVNERAVRILL